MRDRTWRLLWRGGGLVIVAVALGLVVLRSGRPLFYTDGERQVVARDLAEASMLAWDPPVVECELPGPVLDRVQAMPDGRLLYGRSTPDGGSDLVLWDPARPAAGPEPVWALNSTAHELAPALATDNYLYFASDRAGGAGGYDLYRARWLRGGFGPVARLSDAINSPLDETDPAPHPQADTLVFVRRDPEIEAGRNGTLMVTDRNGAQESQPLDTAEEVFGGLCRDPVFSPDGVSLWFVRQDGDAPPVLMRMWRHGDTFAAAVPQRQLSERGPFRAPAPFSDGFAMRLLKQLPEQPALLYTARAREVYPWWAGQAWLELILFVVLVGMLAVELLLLFGRRWRQLDLVTWCILASLLVHVLLLLWMTHVELARRSARPAPQEGMLEVTLLPADGSDGGNGAEPAQLLHDPSQQLQFTSRTRDLSAPAPGGDVATASAPLAAAGARAADLTPDADVTEVDTPLQDAALTQAIRTGNDGDTTIAARAMPVAQAETRGVETTRVSEQRAAAIVVSAPGTDADAMQVGRPLAPAVHAAMALPEVGQVAPLLPDVADARSVEPRRVSGGEGESRDVSIEPRADALTNEQRGAPLPQRPQASSIPAGTGREVPRPDTATLSSAPARSALAGASRQDELPTARPVASAPALRDVPSPQLAASSSRVAQSPAPAPAPVQPLAAATPERRTQTLSPPQRAESAVTPPASGGAAAPMSTTLDARAVTRAAGPGIRSATGLAPRGLGPSTSSLRDAPVAAAESQPRAVRNDTPSVGPQPLLASLAPSPSPAPVTAPQREPARPAVAPSGIQVPGSMLTRAPRRIEMRQQVAPAPVASLFANRVGARKTEALEKYGGNEETERAVQRGLAYLAGIQTNGGNWGSKRRSHEKYGHTTVGKTALCVLAFLGAGHTPQSSSEYSDNVARGVQFLLDEQDADTGHFGYTSAYSHGISTYALAECYGMSGEGELRQRLRQPVERAIDWIISNQNRSGDRRSRGGWGYFSPFLEPEDDFARTSVTAWMVMALESAKLSGFEVPERSLSRAREFLLQCWDSDNGYFLYNREPGRLSTSWRTLPASTPAALFALQLLGEDPADPRLRTGFEYTLARKPTAYRRYSEDAFVQRAAGNPYFWYYGSLSTFLAGGQLWDDWNAALKRVLPVGQERDGSWPAIDPYARYAGDTESDRSYSTVMCVLSLEVYYRYFTPLLRGK